MKKLLLSLAAIPAATLAAEASAQTYGDSNANVTIQNQIAQLQAQIDAGVRTRTIDRAEERRLRQEMRQLTRLERQYARNGLTRSEWSSLQQRVGNISQQVQVAGGYAYGQNGNGYAYGNTGYTYDQYGRRIQVPAYDQYGRPVTNGYYGQGGPYEPYQAPRNNSGIGNVLGNVLGGVLGGGGIGGSVLGSVLGGGGLGVGDLVTGVLGNVLGNVPTGYQNQYRDRNDVYFRSDGQRVYEIDARTNTVIRIHPIR